MKQHPRKVLREMLKGDEIIVAPGAYDGLSACLIEKAGFKVAYQTGAGSSASIIGQPDIGLLTMPEMVTHARNIAAAISIPLIADADTGYGDVINVVRTVHEYEQTGVAAIQFEDQVLPKRCGHLNGKQLVPTKDFVKKLKAAVNERIDKDLVIIARTDARQSEGFDKAIERCKRYIDTGIDVIFFEAPESIDEVERVVKELGTYVPLLSNQVTGGKTPSLTVRELQQLGYKIVIFPSICVYTASVTIKQTLETLKESGTDSGIVKNGNAMDLFRTVGIDEWLALQDKYKD